MLTPVPNLAAYATTTYVAANFAPLASPTFTGTVTRTGKNLYSVPVATNGRYDEIASASMGDGVNWGFVKASGHLTNSGQDYYDDVVSWGFNVGDATGAYLDSSKPMVFYTIENKYYNGSEFGSECHLSIRQVGDPNEIRAFSYFLPHTGTSSDAAAVTHRVNVIDWKNYAGTSKAQWNLRTNTFDFNTAQQLRFLSNNYAWAVQRDAANSAYLNLPYINGFDSLVMSQNCQLIAPRAVAGATYPGTLFVFNMTSANSGDSIIKVFGPATTGNITAFNASCDATTGLISLMFNNSSNGNANVKYQATVNAAGGDPYIQLNINGGQSWALGLDNSDADKFKISASSGLGTNDYLTIHPTSGLATFGKQVTFAAPTTAIASFNLPAGTAPTSPIDGDVWREDNTTTGVKIRVNGVTNAFVLGAGSGTVTNTGGNLTANAIVLGAGTVDTKVVAGIVTDGTSQITLGVNATTLGKVKLFGNTSGDATIQPAAVAGTATVLTLPAATGTLATLAGTETLSGKTLTTPIITNGGSINDENGNEQIKFATTTSAVNDITIKNAATGGSPLIQASGAGTNIDLKLAGKGVGTASFVDASDPTKTMTCVLSGSLANAVSTLIFNNTGSRDYTFPNVTGTVTLIDATQTFTNKTMYATSNVVEEITSTSSSTTPTPTGGSLRNFYFLTAQAATGTFAAPSGTPVNGNLLTIRIKTSGTQTISWNAIYRAIGVTLPASIASGKTCYLEARYNSTDSKWDVFAVATEA